MLPGPLILAAAAALAQAPAPASSGVQVENADVRATIVRAAIVRQKDGLQAGGEDAPRPQLTRRGAQVLIEFE